MEPFAYQRSSALSRVFRQLYAKPRANQAKRWRSLRTRNRKLARLLFVKEREAIQAAVDRAVFGPMTIRNDYGGLAALLAEKPESP